MATSLRPILMLTRGIKILHARTKENKSVKVILVIEIMQTSGNILTQIPTITIRVSGRMTMIERLYIKNKTRNFSLVLPNVNQLYIQKMRVLIKVDVLLTLINIREYEPQLRIGYHKDGTNDVKDPPVFATKTLTICCAHSGIFYDFQGSNEFFCQK